MGEKLNSAVCGGTADWIAYLDIDIVGARDCGFTTIHGSIEGGTSPLHVIEDTGNDGLIIK